jgi:hypothetical protein
VAEKNTANDTANETEQGEAPEALAPAAPRTRNTNKASEKAPGSGKKAKPASKAGRPKPAVETASGDDDDEEEEAEEEERPPPVPATRAPATKQPPVGKKPLVVPPVVVDLAGDDKAARKAARAEAARRTQRAAERAMEAAACAAAAADSDSDESKEPAPKKKKQTKKKQRKKTRRARADSDSGADSLGDSSDESSGSSSSSAAARVNAHKKKHKARGKRENVMVQGEIKRRYVGAPSRSEPAAASSWSLAGPSSPQAFADRVRLAGLIAAAEHSDQARRQSRVMEVAELQTKAQLKYDQSRGRF